MMSAVTPTSSRASASGLPSSIVSVVAIASARWRIRSTALRITFERS